jgi:hypothetical protein
MYGEKIVYEVCLGEQEFALKKTKKNKSLTQEGIKFT